MNKSKKNVSELGRVFSKRHLVKTIMIASLITHSLTNMAQTTLKEQSTDSSLLKQFIQAQNYNNPIIFDAANIKQYWIDKSVSSKNQSINILLYETSKKEYESVPLKIQLSNTNASLNCKIDVFTKNDGVSFSISDTKGKVLTDSKETTDFLEYNVVSSTVHWEDIKDSSFSMTFKSKNDLDLKIEAIVLSFSNNNTFLHSPGILKLNKDNSILLNDAKYDDDKKTFSVKGKNILVNARNKIIVADQPITVTAKIRNTGTVSTTIRLGYITFSKDAKKIDRRNFPYNNKNEVLNVVSVNNEKNIIVVDKNAKWEKNCSIALNAKEDMSDIPNVSLLNSLVEDFKDLENGQYEISLSTSPQNIKANDKIRIHGVSKANLYINKASLQPNEVVDVSFTIKRDNDFLQFSPKAFSKDVFYVIPFIRSDSTDSNSDSIIKIDEFSVAY